MQTYKVWEDKKNILCGIIEGRNHSKEESMILRKSHKTVDLSRSSSLCLKQLQAVKRWLGLNSEYSWIYCLFFFFLSVAILVLPYFSHKLCSRVFNSFLNNCLVVFSHHQTAWMGVLSLRLCWELGRPELENRVPLCCEHWAIIHRKGSTIGRGLKSGKHDLHGRSIQSTEEGYWREVPKQSMGWTELYQNHYTGKRLNVPMLQTCVQVRCWSWPFFICP